MAWWATEVEFSVDGTLPSLGRPPRVQKGHGALDPLLRQTSLLGLMAWAVKGTGGRGLVSLGKQTA